METRVKINFEEVTKIYYGKDRWCRCGCGGCYAEKGTRLFKRYQGQIEAIKDGTSNRKLQSVDVDCNNTNLSLENNRAFTVYFD